MRERIQRRTFDLATRVGLGQTALRAADRLGVTDHTHLDALDLQHDVGRDDPDGHVLLPLIPGSTLNNYRLAVLGYAFRTRGIEPIHLVGDDAFDAVPNLTFDANESTARARSQYEARRVATAFGVTPTPVSSLLDHPPAVELPDDCTGMTYRGVPVGDYAEASTRKYAKRYDVDVTSGDERRIFRRFVRSALVLVDACIATFDEYDVRAVVTVEDPYVHGGVPLSVAVDRDTPAYSNEMGFRDGTVIFGRKTNRNSQPQYTRHALLERIVDEPLTDGQRERTHRAVADRKNGGGLYNYSAMDSKAIDLDPARTTVGLFSNLIWDGMVELDGGNDAVGHPVEWIERAIDELGGRDDVQLVVKTHPAEDVYGTEQTVEGWIHEHCAPLPSNVTVVSSGDAINTYELIELLDAGIVYLSTVGLEMAYEGLPVVVVGDAHYRELGFTYDPTSTAAYESLLSRVTDLDAKPEQRTLATRYLHFLFFEKCIDFPFYTTGRETQEIELRAASHDDLRPGTEPFDSLVDSMLAGEAVLTPSPRRPKLARID